MPELSSEQLQSYINTAVDLTMSYVPRVLLAIVLLIIGFWVIRRFVNLLGATLANADVDVSLTRFLQSLLSVGLKVLLLISAASMVGIATTSFVAVLGAAGLAIGLALQGSLANLAGGVLVLLFKPYRVGDFIEAQGVAGTVKEIQIFSTIINTTDNKVIIIPNGKLSNDVITNYSLEQTRRADWLFGISYTDDIGKARQLIAEVLAADSRVHRDPEPLIAVSELADSSVNITVRCWVDASDLWPVKFDTLEAVKLKFDAAGITIPFPQSELHIVNNPAS